MRRKTMRRMLVAMQHQPFIPTDEQRKLVTLLKLNGTPHQRIANQLRTSLIELEYYFAYELGIGQDALLAHAADNILGLADQRADLGVALRANQAILGPRIKSWREAAIDPATNVGSIDDLTLEQVEAEIVRLERERRTAAETAQAAAGSDSDEAEPA